MRHCRICPYPMFCKMGGNYLILIPSFFSAIFFALRGMRTTCLGAAAGCFAFFMYTRYGIYREGCKF
jgi:hypothetical protein